MKKLHLNKIKISDLNLNAMDEISMENLQGGVHIPRTDLDRNEFMRTDGCTDGNTSGCTDGCGIFGTAYHCTNSYCTDDCPTGIPQGTTKVACH